MYAKRYFPLEAKSVADEMVQYVRAEFKRILEEIQWMDPVTSRKANTKADKMISHIAYSEEILDNALLDDFYSGLKLESDSFLLNILSLKTFIRGHQAREFRSEVDPRDWRTHSGAALVDAYYNSDENSITFPAGILGGVFFNKDRPQYMNYGAIGVVVGHEITHGFDDAGSQKDEEGNLVDWWQPRTKAGVRVVISSSLELLHREIV